MRKELFTEDFKRKVVQYVLEGYTERGIGKRNFKSKSGGQTERF